MAISEEEKNRRNQERVNLLNFFYDCIVEIERILSLGLAWDDAVGAALLEYGWDLIPARDEET